MPSVVIMIPDPALRQLMQHAFAVAGWATNVAHSALDALALAFNVEADRIVATTADGAADGLLDQLAADDVLSETPCSLLVSTVSLREWPAGVRTSEFAMPCDPYWLVVHADTHIGRETPSGLGRRPASDDPCDLALYEWWWTLAAFHLVRDAVVGEADDVLGRIARRTGTRISMMSDAPEADDIAGWAPLEQSMAWRVPSGVAWWLVEAEPGDLTPQSVACVSAVAGTIGAARK